jgi:hypothetical protein
MHFRSIDAQLHIISQHLSAGRVAVSTMLRRSSTTAVPEPGWWLANGAGAGML